MNETVIPKTEPKKIEPERRIAQRYVARFPVRAEWKDDSSGKKIVSEGATENVGQGSVLVRLDSLPHVGSRVRISVLDDEAKLRCAATTEVIRIERHPGHPLAALQLLDTLDKWRRAIWETAAPPPPPPKPLKDEAQSDDESDI
ncbi:MAG: hypothetical protein NVSMB56_16520 [Pyrinomonadaceae bacterium]